MIINWVTYEMGNIRNGQYKKWVALETSHI